MKIKPFQVPHDVKVENEKKDYAKFVIGPLERGFGTTMGNLFRRILLSSIHGVGITKVKFDKVYHEFSTIDGVKENVTDIILNIKKLRFKISDDNEDDEKIITLKVKGSKEVTGNDITLPPDVEIANPEQYLFTITKKTNIKIEMHIEIGRGYLPAQNIKQDKTIGIIAIDAFFSPIKRVITNIENMRVGQRTDYDKLILEVFTDGTITPKDALEEAIVILQGHIKIFDIKNKVLPVVVEELEDEYILKMRELLNKRVTELDLSNRAKNCLESNDIITLGDLVSKPMDEMLKYKNFGKQSLGQLQDKLKDLGLDFGMDVSKFLNKEEN